MIKTYFKLYSTILVCLLFACNKDLSNIETDPSTSVIEEPNYEIVFPQDKVNTLEITLSKAAWDSIRTDMISKAGSDFGANPGGNQGGNQGGAMGTGPGGQMPGGLPPGGANGGGGAGGGALDIIPGDPIWVSSTVKFEGKEWKSVGFRLKGNSSLSQAWGAGVYKLPFKIEFDQFEDKVPSTKNQRFYGFKEFSMSPGQGDNSLMRDKIVSDLFRDAGIPSAKTAFYKIYINFGDGLKYCGVYTMVEVIDDSMVKTQFGEKSGNIYKPESTFSSFVQSVFEKKSNETAANYSDVQSFITALNAANRTTNAATWRANLEKTFNVDHFLKYLAINNTIVNWDAYGALAHNYYLYTPKATGQVTWIPWDFNLSMTASQTGTTQQGNGMGRGVSLEMSEVATSWPLIRYLADDPTYLLKYKTYVKDFNDKYFQESRMNAILDKETNLISAAVAQEVAPYSFLSNQSAFTSAVSQLKLHVATRNTAVTTYLSK